MPNIQWIITNCNTNKEAWDIGYKLLEKRLIACFDVVSRVKTAYFWPPQSGKIEKGKGTMLICVSMPKDFKKASKIIHSSHSDDIPFVGSIELKNVSARYVNWLKNEIK